MCMQGLGVYYSDPWNVLGSLQMVLFLIDSITWLVRPYTRTHPSPTRIPERRESNGVERL